MKEKTNFGTNFEAYFLGPKAENEPFYAKLLEETLRDHCAWRRAFHSQDDAEFITSVDKDHPDFIIAQKKIESTLIRLRELLKSSQPFFSPRYIGHMNWEVMAAPIVAFLSAALYNPNNVASAGSTGTSTLEIEVGKDLLRLFGMDEEKGWGHICAGGTIANMESLWIARNMKAIPLVLRDLVKKYGWMKKRFDTAKFKIALADLSEFELLSRFMPEEILDLKEIVLNTLKRYFDKDEVDDTYDRLTMQERGFQWGKNVIDPGVIFMPQTKHYSLKKAVDLLGLGRTNIRYVPVDKNFRMDIKRLRNSIIEESQGRPILAVVAVAGSTEESAVDEIHKIVEIRSSLAKKNKIGFHIHVDAAYGGYARSLFLDEKGRFMSKAKLDLQLKKMAIIGDSPNRRYASWPNRVVFDAFKAMPTADTITVDPHKLGYVLYPAGGIVLKDKRMRESIHTYAPYVFRKPKADEPDILIGSYILEGSKPGASVAAAWTAHRIMPLNITGYGKLIGETIDGAQALWHSLKNADAFELDDELRIRVYPLLKPDLNIVNYVFNFENNTKLSILNKLTEYIGDHILGHTLESGGTMIEKQFIISNTDFDEEEYGDSPVSFLKDIGIPEKEWQKVRKVKILRSVVMSPYLTPDFVDDNYAGRFIAYLQKEILKHKEHILSITHRNPS